MPYGYRRWSGVAWCDPWIDRYNRLLDNAVTRHRQGLDATAYVDALYRTAQHFDVLARDTA